MPKPPLGLRVLILAPVGQDARLIAKALVAVGLDATAVTSMDEVIERSCQDGVGTLLIAEEALTPSAVQKLSARLSAQDSWEDLSVLILTAGGQSTAASRKREEDRLALGSVTLLERPIRMATLLSSVTSALRSRARQYEVRDILLERDAANAALIDTEKQLRLAIETARLGAWTLDLETSAFTASDTCRTSLDLPPTEDLTYQDLQDRIHPDDRAFAHLQMMESITNGTPFSVEYRVLWQDGTIRWIAATGRRLHEEDGRTSKSTQKMSGVTLDTTERVLSEEALRKADKLALVGRLASSIAHEINNPLESVTNLLYLLGTSDLSEALNGYVSTAQQELQRVSEIVAQTLSFTRASQARVEAVITEIIESVLSLYQGRLNTSGIVVERDFQSHTKVCCYPGEVRQVITNLIGNAFDATRKGGRIILREREATDFGTGQHGIRITVADTGVGIPEANRRTMFEAFHSTKGNNGTGLGLWISKGIVQKHHGRLRYSSSTKPNHSGTVFSIFLPREGPSK